MRVCVIYIYIYSNLLCKSLIFDRFQYWIAWIYISIRIDLYIYKNIYIGSMSQISLEL